MITLVWLLLAIGLAPLVAGAARLEPSSARLNLDPGSILLCALAFNLTFFWQELWLVIPKALTPGLHPILYHNNHDWTGHAPTAELLQGTGALATLTSGLAFLAALALARRVSVTWRIFLFWMAFQGLYQALSQLAIGSVTPGNDVGRALAYLNVDAAARWAALSLAVVAMAFAGGLLARLWPRASEQGATGPTRLFVRNMLATAALAALLIVPFRLPRDLIEAAFIPLFVNLVGVGWLVLGAAYAPGAQPDASEARAAIAGPTVALVATLVVFQLILRPGIAF